MTATSHTTLALDGRAAARHVPLGASVIAFSAGLVWSIGTLTARLAKHSDAWQYLLWRSIGVVVVVEIYGYWSGKGSMIRRCFGGGRTMVIATLGLALSSLGYVYAVKNTTAANAAFLSSITPLITVMFSRFFLGERLNKVTIVALSAAVCGLAITVSGDFQSGNMAGNVSAVFCSIGFAIYTIALRSDPSRDWSPSMAGYAVVLIVVCGSVAAGTSPTLVPPIGDIGFAVFHGAVLIVVGTLLFNIGSRTVPAVAITVLAQSEIAFAPVWVYIALGEAPGIRSLIGGSIIVGAVIGKALFDARPMRVLANQDLLEAPPQSGPAAV